MSDDAHDLGAEQSLLGSVLVNPTAAGHALLAVPDDAWWVPKHAEIASVLGDRLRREDPIDPQLVLTELRAQTGFTDGHYLVTLMERAWTPGVADHYAHRVLRCAARRGLSAACTRIRQVLNEQSVNGYDDGPIWPIVRELQDACDQAENRDAGMDLDRPSANVSDLSAEPDVLNWLVPGLLERGERIMITGGEGLGKSWLSSQIAATLAAGMHPFTGNVLGRGDHHLRVLVIDCENSRGQIKRRFRRVAAAVDGTLNAMERDPDQWKQGVRMEIHPAGVDLLGKDGGWLERKIAANDPDLLVIGPLYKLHTASMNDEPAARALVQIMDGIRTRYGCALLIEAHAGHERDPRGFRSWRPAGSSLFLRWPEFGFGLARAKGEDDEHPRVIDVAPWRGSREDRQWPRQLRHGGATDLPWVPVDLRYFEDAG